MYCNYRTLLLNIKYYICSNDGAGQQCCYDLNGYLMMTSDNKWGGKPMRSHNIGVLPWNEAAKIPSLSHWLQDVSPFYPCCMWQSEQSGGCQTYRFERRASQDCVGYLPPGGGNNYPSKASCVYVCECLCVSVCGIPATWRR